jgi:paraquat-inducible protein A
MNTSRPVADFPQWHSGMAVCRDCDALIRVSETKPAECRCPRCGCIVGRAASGRLDSALAMYIAAGVCFLMANVFPILTIEAAGNQVNVTLTGAAFALRNQELGVMSLVVLATTVAVPAIELMSAIALLLLVKVRRSTQYIGLFFRVRQSLRPWSMLEIFVLGALVAFVKLGSIANVIAGAGIWSLGAFMVSSAAASHALDQSALWSKLGARH